MPPTDSPRFPSIDRRQLRALLTCYYRLTVRGRMAQSAPGGQSSRGLFFVVGMYALFGMMTGAMVLATHADVFTYAVFVHSLTFLVVGMALVSESGDILFNANESDVLLHRPIHPRTLLLAKSINMVAFTLAVAAALNLFPIFMGLAARGATWWFPIVHAISSIALCIFCAAAVVCSYGLVVKVVGRKKFESLATWSQVVLSVLFIGGYQVVPRLIERFGNVSLTPHSAYLIPLPPAWFAGFDAWLGGREPVPAAIPLAIAGALASAVLPFVAIGRLGPAYGTATIALTESREDHRAAARRRYRSVSPWNPLLRWWLSDPIERRAFQLAAVYMRRDRDVRLRLYPTLGLVVMYSMMSLVGGARDGFAGFMFPIIVWMLGLLPLQVMQTLQVSAHCRAADVFAAAPLANTSPLFHGVRKASLYYLFAPAVCVVAGIGLYRWPHSADVPLVVLASVIAAPVVSLAPGLVEEYLPLSRPVERGEQSSRTAILMWGTMLPMGVVVGVAWMARTYGILWYLVAGELTAALLLYRTLNNRIKSRGFAAG